MSVAGRKFTNIIGRNFHCDSGIASFGQLKQRLVIGVILRAVKLASPLHPASSDR